MHPDSLLWAVLWRYHSGSHSADVLAYLEWTWKIKGNFCAGCLCLCPTTMPGTEGLPNSRWCRLAPRHVPCFLLLLPQHLNTSPASPHLPLSKPAYCSRQNQSHSARSPCKPNHFQMRLQKWHQRIWKQKKAGPLDRAAQWAWLSDVCRHRPNEQPWRLANYRDAGFPRGEKVIRH